MLFTVAHELTHFIRQWSPAKFDALADAVIQLVYKEKGISVVKLVRSQQAKAERNGRTIDFDTAYEEVVADSMESILTSGRVAEMMAQLQQEDQSLWQKIRQWFQKLAQDIRQAVRAYAGYKPDSAEGRAVAQMEQLLPILEGFYQDALQEAGENYRAAEGQKNTTGDGGVKKLSIRNIVGSDQKFYGLGVHLDSTLLDGLSPADRIKTVKSVIKQLGGEKFAAYDESGGKVIISIANADERFSNSSGRRVAVNRDLSTKYRQNEIKQESIVLVDEVIATANRTGTRPPKYAHGWLDDEGKKNWEYWKTFVQDKNNSIWEVTLNVANSADGRKILYDIGPIKSIGGAASQISHIPTDATAMVAQNESNVKKNFSARQEKVDIEALRKELQTVSAEKKYSYGGRGAATADHSALQQAEELAQQGMNNEAIRQQTGWYKGMDGQWRYEIDDSQMKISDDIINYMRLGDLMQHEKLYAAYPDLADISVVFQRLEDGVNGSYHAQFDSINLSYQLKNDPAGLKDALVHELQHAIQHREGFTSGASVESWERKIKEGFDSRRAADIRKAQQTQRELHRIQEEEPEFYRDMVELDAMTPNLPRGEIDWETLEQIEEDPIEWQQYDARREALEAQYGDTKVWDMNDLLYQQKQAAKNIGRSGVELYFDTAGEIEARDASNRRSKSPEERKTTPPRLGNEDTVFFEEKDSQQVEGQKNTTGDGGVKMLSIRNTSRMTLEEQLKKYYKGELKTSDSLYFGETPDSVLQSGLEPLPLAFPTANFKKSTQDKHNVPRRAIKGLRSSLEKALFSFGKDGRFGFVVPDIDADGKPLLIGIETNVEMDRQKVNVIRSVYGLDNPKAWIQNQIQAGKELAVYDKKRADSWLQTYGYLALVGDGIELSESSVAQHESNVNKKLSSQQEKTDIRYSDRDPLQKKALEKLEKENAALQEDMKQLKEWNKLQKQVTGGKMLTPRSVEAAARYLKKLFYAGGDAKELAQKLKGVYEYILNDPESTWEGVQEAAEPAIRWLQGNEKTRKSQYAQEILATLKGRNFRLDEVQLGEVRHQYGSLKEYRRAVKNMASSKAGMSLDELWQEMASQYPDIFDAEVNAADMPEAFAQVLERLENMEDSESAMEQSVKDQAMLREIYDSYWRVTVLETRADKHKKEIAAIRDKHTVKMAELRQKRDAALEELREEKKASVEGVRDTRNKADMRKKIRRKIMELQKLLLRGNKKQNVKEGMQDFAATALASAEILFMDNYSNEDMVRNGVGVEVDATESRLIDETQKLLNMRKDLYNEGLIRQEAEEVMVYGESSSYEKRMAKSAELDRKISENMRNLKGVFERERNRLNKATVAGILGELASSYRKLASSDMVYIRGAFDENVYQHLNQLQENMGGTTVRDMSLRQLKELAEAYTMVLSTVRNANRLFNEKLNMSRDEAAGKVIREIRSSGKQRSKARLPGHQSAETFSWNNEKPVYAFERLGSETMMAQYQAIRDGQDTYAEDMQAAKAYRQEQEETYHRKDWDMDKLHDFQLESGKVQLNIAQMMSIYALSKRKEGLAHLLGGGFVFGTDAKRIISKAGVPMTYLVEDATAYRLTVEEINQIANTLTKEQRAFADAMQKYLADVMGSKGNEVSMALYGVKSFSDEHYFPIRSSGQYMERAKLQAMQKSQGQINLVNSGFTKSTVPNAKNPVALDGFLDVWADHVQEMSMYHGLALPLEDFRRVYNYAPAVQEGQMAVSVNAVIENAYGRAATGYLDQLYKDLNADVVVDNRETIGKKMVGKFKAAAVMASASVVIQQFSALPRAFALIDPKYFIGRKLDKKKHDQLWAELKKYAPVAFIKEMGYFDTGVGMSGKQYLLQQEYGSIREKLAALIQDENYRDEVLGKLPALADEMTWCGIWEAVKRETLERNPKMDVRSEPFLKLAGKRFSEIIDKTQVYDSVLSRSANMRSKAWYMNVITSFMAEPTTTINMVEDVIRKGDKKQIARTLGSVLLSQTMNALLVSLVYAARDDDEDKTWLEKYLSTVTVEMLEGFNPLGYYPLLKDVWSLMQGYDVERPDMTLVSEMVKAANRLTDAQEKLSKAETEEEQTAAQKALQSAMWGIADAVASLMGLPLKNIRRDVNGAVSLAKTAWADASQRDTTALSLQDAVWNEVMQSIPFFGSRYYKDRRDKLYGAMVADDGEYTRRLEKTYASESTFHGAVRTALREHDSRIWEAAVAWNEGKLEEYLNIAKEILGESHFEQDDIVLAIRAEAESMLEKKAPGEGKAIGIFNAEKLGVALAQDNGKMVKIICQDLIDTDMANGKTKEEAKDALESDVRRELKQRYLEGDLNRNLAVRQLARHGGMTQEEAKAKVAGWDWFKANPDSEATEADVSGYLKALPELGRSMKDYGLSMDTYRKEKKAIGAFEADKDEKGESIPYSKINKAFPYIRDLPLSAEQKTALAVACGWSLKTVEQNKLW